MTVTINIPSSLSASSMSAMAANLAAIMLQIPMGEYLGKSCLDSIQYEMVCNGVKGVKLMVYSVMIQNNVPSMRFKCKKTQIATIMGDKSYFICI